MEFPKIDPLELKMLGICAIGGLLGVFLGAAIVLGALRSARKRAELAAAETPRQVPKGETAVAVMPTHEPLRG